MTGRKTPELLAPAGTKAALDAAIRGGADAVYFGGSRFNARMMADNFDDAAMEDAIRTCAFYGVKSNITLNTLSTERELCDVLLYAEKLCRWGADAIICADLGLASLIHRYFPETELHASTQCAGHNTDAARYLADLGFSRMVAARELSFENLTALCRTSPIEAELFIHGALCVSQSGGCLFSSLVGGRSGNRGACAQPCRLPHTVECIGCKSAKQAKNTEDYPLSLKDYCLASHVPELLSLGAASFKIEGRMKSPAYVEGVVRIWRRLLDEKRNADKGELAALAALFSRGGTFTDGYFRAVTGASMRGIRTEDDKQKTSRAEKEIAAGRKTEKKIPCEIRCDVKTGEPVSLSMSAQNVSVSVCGEIPAPAQNRPTTEEDIRVSVSKLGSTPFAANTVTVHCDGGLSCPQSALNALRRDAANALENAYRRVTDPKRDRAQINAATVTAQHPAPFAGKHPYACQASFLFCDSIPKEAAEYYDIRYLPLETFAADPARAVSVGINGVTLPPIVFDTEWDTVDMWLAVAHGAGIRHALIANVGHIARAKAHGFLLHGDLRLNLWNAHTANTFARDLEDILLSPELTPAQMRDTKTVLPRGAVTYGRLPMMTLARCILREYIGNGAEVPSTPGKNSCTYCDRHPVSYLCDRKQMRFPVTRGAFHRNIIHNAAPVYMADKVQEVARIGLDFTHHVFCVESKEAVSAVIAAYRGDTEKIRPENFRRL